MAHVIVMHGRDVIQKIKLEKVENLIGRSLGAEIPLDNVLVSRRHAMLAKERGIWIVRELSGKNGIYVNGERVRKHALRDGDQIGVGKYTIRFLVSRDEVERDLAVAHGKPGADFKVSTGDLLGGKTDKEAVKRVVQKVNSSESTMRLDKSELDTLRQQMNLRQKAHFVAVTQMSRATFPLDKTVVTIGRDKSCDIPLPGGLFVGKVHAEVKFNGKAWLIEHISGMAGIKVNGNKVTQAALSDGDEVKIGSHCIRFLDDMH